MGFSVLLSVDIKSTYSKEATDFLQFSAVLILPSEDRFSNNIGIILGVLSPCNNYAILMSAPCTELFSVGDNRLLLPFKRYNKLSAVSEKQYMRAELVSFLVSNLQYM